MELHEYAGYDATGLAELVRRREVSAAELVRLAREAHDLVNPTINAVVEFYEDAESIAGSDTGPFAGVPFLRKDAGLTEAGRLQEMGSRLFQGVQPTVESYFFQRARAAGLRILGRTTLPEFGSSGLSESLAWGITRNPWNLERTAGGSSSGSAAAVAAGIVPIAHGSDGGGSIRIPAAYCGLVGLNPSRGRISGGPNRQDTGSGRSRSFVLCRSVRDTASALDVFSGAYPGDPFVIAPPQRPYVEELKRPVGRLRIGVAISPWAEADLAPDIREAVVKTAKQLEDMGHFVEAMEQPFDTAVHRKIAESVFYMGFAGLDDTARALGREVDEHTVERLNREFHRIGKSLPLSYALEVFEAERRIRADLGEATKDFDILVTPVMPYAPLRHGTFFSTASEQFTPEQFIDADAATYSYVDLFNLTGQPSVSLPLFHDADGLPIGVQIVARFGGEATLVRLARDLEEALPWAARLPPVHAGNLQQVSPQ